jgi:hypothetical protein
MDFFSLPIDIIDTIFYGFDYDDMVNFSLVNRYTYRMYTEHVKKKIYSYISRDYKLFRKCFFRYKYDNDDILDFGINALTNLTKVYVSSGLYSCYDLRYLFELILVGLDLKNNEIIVLCRDKSIGYEYNNQLEFMLQKIKKSISFTRFETIHNINKEPCLGMLHNMFKPYLNNTNWIYI